MRADGAEDADGNRLCNREHRTGVVHRTTIDVNCDRDRTSCRDGQRDRSGPLVCATAVAPAGPTDRGRSAVPNAR